MMVPVIRAVVDLETVALVTVARLEWIKLHRGRSPTDRKRLGLQDGRPLRHCSGHGEGRITWPQLATLTSANPARIFGLRGKGALAVGYDADLVIYDPRVETTIRAEALHNLAGYTPYEG